MSNLYPTSVTNVLDRSMTFKRAVIREMIAYSRAKPWRGTIRQRAEKMMALNIALATVYRIESPKMRFLHIRPEVAGTINGNGSYDRSSHEITLVGSLSVITYLHEFAHALGKDEEGAARWSVNLFRRIFPKSFGKLYQTRHVLMRVQPPNHRPEAYELAATSPVGPRQTRRALPTPRA